MRLATPTVPTVPTGLTYEQITCHRLYDMCCGSRPLIEGLVMPKPDFIVEATVRCPSCGDALTLPADLILTEWNKRKRGL